MKFNVGDKVRVINYPQYNGSETTIILVDHNGTEDVYYTPIFNFFENEIELLLPTGYGLAARTLEPQGCSNLQQIVLPKKCECGCAFIGVNNHSDYCPLYTRE